MAKVNSQGQTLERVEVTTPIIPQQGDTMIYGMSRGVYDSLPQVAREALANLHAKAEDSAALVKKAEAKLQAASLSMSQGSYQDKRNVWINLPVASLIMTEGEADLIAFGGFKKPVSVSEAVLQAAIGQVREFLPTFQKGMTFDAVFALAKPKKIPKETTGNNS
jgi:hypothetical protein